MSELFLNGLAIIAVCAAGLGAAALVTRKAVVKSVNALPDDMKKTYDDLKKLVETDQPEVATPKEAVEKVNQDLKRFTSDVQAPTTMDEKRAHRLAALSNSPLLEFVEERDIQELVKNTNDKSFERLLNNAADSMQNTQFEKVNENIIDVAKDTGFKTVNYDNRSDSGGVVSLLDPNGRSVIAKTKSTENGVRLDMDVTGFPKGECQQVMDELFAKLQKRGVDFRQGDRLSRDIRSFKKHKISQKRKQKSKQRKLNVQLN